MAGLKQFYDTNKNLYAIIRNDAGEVWSTDGTPAFETYSAANYDHYTLDAAEQGATGLYLVSTPATLTAGINYMADWRVRIGGSNAVSDPCIGCQNHLAVHDAGVQNAVDAAKAIPKPLTRPPDKAFQAWQIRELVGISKQGEIADIMTKKGVPATQGQVSRWLKVVEKWRLAGGLMPEVGTLEGKPQCVDPDILDMGARQDGLTPRQRPRRDDDADE